MNNKPYGTSRPSEKAEGSADNIKKCSKNNLKWTPSITKG